MNCGADEAKTLLGNLAEKLVEGGKIFADFRTKEDSMYGKGEKIGEDYFLLDNSNGSLSGITYRFDSIERIRALYKAIGLKITNVDKLDFYTNNMIIHNSHFYIEAEK